MREREQQRENKRERERERERKREREHQVEKDSYTTHNTDTVEIYQQTYRHVNRDIYQNAHLTPFR